MNRNRTTASVPTTAQDADEEDDRRIDAGRNRLLGACIRRAGFSTIADLSRRLEADGTPVGPTVLSLLVRGRIPAMRRDGRWHEHVQRLCDLLGSDPEDLFAPAHRSHPDDPTMRSDVMEAFESDRLAAQTEAPDEACARREFEGVVRKALLTLTAREERVLRSRFGIGDDRDMTFDEVGAVLGATRERVRQIESKALRKLKHPSRSRLLRAAAWGSLPDERPWSDKDPHVPQSIRKERPVFSRLERRRPFEGGRRWEWWPDMRNYGLVLVRAAAAARPPILLVRNDDAVPANTLAPALRRFHQRATAFSDVLYRLGFVRSDEGDGSYGNESGEMSVDEFLAAFPACRAVQVVPDEVTFVLVEPEWRRPSARRPQDRTPAGCGTSQGFAVAVHGRR